MNNTRLLVHAGFAKCGSTTIQKGIDSDRVELRQDGVWVVGSTIGNDISLFRNNMTAYLKLNPSEDLEVYESVEKLLRDEILTTWDNARDSGASCVVISHEDIAGSFSRFSRLLPPDVNVDVVLGIRSPEEWTQSMYVQRLKDLNSEITGWYKDHVESIISDDNSFFVTVVQIIERHPRVQRVELFQVSQGDLGVLLDYFYKKVLGVERNLRKVLHENRSLSLIQIMLLRQIQQATVRDTKTKPGVKSISQRLLEIISSDTSQIPIKERLISGSDEILFTKANLEKSTLLRDYGIEIQESDFLARPGLDLDSVDVIHGSAIRILIRAFLQLCIELLNGEEREWIPDFELEVSSFLSNKIRFPDNAWKKMSGDIRQIDELLGLLGQEFPSKSPTCRLREIMWEHLGLQSFSLTVIDENELRNTISLTSLSLIISCVMQCSWEVFNSKDRDWDSQFSAVELTLVRNLFCSLASPRLN